MTSVKRSPDTLIRCEVQWVGYSIAAEPWRQVGFPFSKYKASMPGCRYSDST